MIDFFPRVMIDLAGIVVPLDEIVVDRDQHENGRIERISGEKIFSANLRPDG